MRYTLLLILAIALWQTVAWSAPRPVTIEPDLVTLGNTRAKVRAVLGICTGYLYARPEYVLMGPVPTPPDPGQPPKHTMILVDSQGNETELPLAGAQPPPGGELSKDLPMWAYMVHVPFLALSQELWIYRINDYYTIGIVFDGKTDAAKVTDIIACTLEPFLEKFNPLTGKYEPAPVRKEAYNLRSTSRTGPSSGRNIRVCTTDKGIVLGSTFRDILMGHGWTPLQFPFITKELTRRQARNAADMGKPIDATKLIQNDPNMEPSPYPLPAGMNPNNAQNFGSLLAKFYSPVSDSPPYIAAGFTRDMMVCYPKEKMIFTLIEHTVVRIHIGQGAGSPPPPPPSATGAGGAGAGGAGGGITTFPTPPTDGGTTTAPPPIAPEIKPNGGTKLPPLPPIDPGGFDLPPLPPII